MCNVGGKHMLDGCKKGDLVNIDGVYYTVTKVYRDEKGDVWKVTCKLN